MAGVDFHKTYNSVHHDWILSLQLSLECIKICQFVYSNFYEIPEDSTYLWWDNFW